MHKLALFERNHNNADALCHRACTCTWCKPMHNDVSCVLLLFSSYYKKALWICLRMRFRQDRRRNTIVPICIDYCKCIYIGTVWKQSEHRRACYRACTWSMHNDVSCFCLFSWTQTKNCESASGSVNFDGAVYYVVQLLDNVMRGLITHWDIMTVLNRLCLC